MDNKLNAVSINKVITNPNQKIISNKELDLLIEGIDNIKISMFLNILKQIDKKGPHPWIHPAIIVRDDGRIHYIEDFVRKPYASITKGNSEFYSVLPNNSSKEHLDKYLARLCKNIKDRKNITIHRGSLFISKSFINKELDDYIRENL